MSGKASSETSFSFMCRKRSARARAFAMLSEEEQDLRMQSRIHSWMEAINRAGERKESIKIRCLNCKTLNPENAKFCNECVSPLV